MADWYRDDAGNLLVDMLTGIATAASPDGSIGVVRLTYDPASEQPERTPGALQLAMRPQHIRDLIDALQRLEQQLILNSPPAGSA